ncbi:DedD protein [Gammaproteobacteria bacterium]
MKKRVIGVAALASLAVIFVPMLVEQSPDYTPPIPGMAVPRPDFDAKHQERLQPLADDLTRLEKAGNPVIQQLDTPVTLPAVPEKPHRPTATGPVKPVAETLSLKVHPTPAKLTLESSSPRVHATPAKLTVDSPVQKPRLASGSSPAQTHSPPKITRVSVAEPHTSPSSPAAPLVVTQKPADKPKALEKVVKSPPPKEKAKEKPKEPGQGTGTTWAVQVGSFATAEKASGIVEQLRGKGFAAFQESVVINHRTLYRVRIGPDNDKNHTEKVAGQIQQQFALPGRVIRYR